MIGQGVHLATKGRIGNSAVTYVTFGKIWDGFITSTQSAFQFVRSLLLGEFECQKRGCSFSVPKRERSFSVPKRGWVFSRSRGK